MNDLQENCTLEECELIAETMEAWASEERKNEEWQPTAEAAKK